MLRSVQSVRQISLRFVVAKDPWANSNRRITFGRLQWNSCVLLSCILNRVRTMSRDGLASNPLKAGEKPTVCGPLSNAFVVETQAPSAKVNPKFIRGYWSVHDD